MKKIIFLISSLITISTYAQESNVIIKEDTIIKKSKPFGLSENWDFSDIIFSNYPNTNDSDLVRLKDPISVYTNQIFNTIGDSITQPLVQKSFTQQNITITRSGYYTAIYEGQGTVKIPGQTFTNSEKIKIIERYNFKFSNDSVPVASYINTYYTFFNKTTHNHLISVFQKKRLLKSNIGDEIIGIGYSIIGGNNSNFTSSNVQMNLNPNPANNVTTVNYNLVNSANVKIELSNQLGTINNIIFSGNKPAGNNQKTIPLNQYQSGLYNVKLTIDGNVFSQSLIIQ